MQTIENFLNSYLSEDLDINKYMNFLDKNAQVILVRNKKKIIIGGCNELYEMVSEGHFPICLYANIMEKKIIEGEDGLFLCTVKSIQCRKSDEIDNDELKFAIVTDYQIIQLTNDKITFLQHNWNNEILDMTNPDDKEIVKKYAGKMLI